MKIIKEGRKTTYKVEPRQGVREKSKKPDKPVKKAKDSYSEPEPYNKPTNQEDE